MMHAKQIASVKQVTNSMEIFLIKIQSFVINELVLVEVELPSNATGLHATTLIHLTKIVFWSQILGNVAHITRAVSLTFSIYKIVYYPISFEIPAEKQSDQEGPRSDVCIFNDKEYVKGQSIPTGEPCKRCNCVEGFSGKVEYLAFNN